MRFQTGVPTSPASLSSATSRPEQTIDDGENDEARDADAEAPLDKLFLYGQKRLRLDLAAKRLVLAVRTSNNLT